MLAKIKQIIAFFKEVFSEDGQGSFSRVIQGFIVMMTCGWVSYIVFRTRAIPDLSGPATFVGAGSLHYMTNKLPDIMNALKGTTDSTENVQTPQDSATPANTTPQEPA